MSALRWLPALGLVVLLVAVVVWVLLQPVSDVRASLGGFVVVTLLCMALIPALHLAIDW